MSAALRFHLPLPPSVNACTINLRSGGRAKSKKYKQWRTEAGWIVQSSECRHIDGAYALAISVPQRMRGDIDNRIKAVADLLVAHDITDDDRHAADVRIRRAADVPAGTCVVEVLPLSTVRDAERRAPGSGEPEQLLAPCPT